MAAKGTGYTDAYELIDRKNDDTKKEYTKLSRRRPIKTLRIVAAGFAFMLTLTALVLVIAFRVDADNRIEHNQETQAQSNEQASSQKSEQDDINDLFQELLNHVSEDIHYRLNNSREVIEAFMNASNLTASTLRLQLSDEIIEVLSQLNTSNDNIRGELASSEQALLIQLDGFNQTRYSEDMQIRNELALSIDILQSQQDQTNNTLQSLGSRLEQQVENIVSQITNISEAILSQINSSQAEILDTVSKLQCPGLHQRQPAATCQEVIDCDPTSTNGLYWLLGADNSLVYCDFNWTCGNHNITGPWRRVKYLDLQNGIHSRCPSGLTRRRNPVLSCGLDDGNRCNLVVLETNQIPYNKVCGKIIAHQSGNPDGFRGADGKPGYVDGISLTYSTNPQIHIWSFAANRNFAGNQCPCNTNDISNTGNIIVGTDYFCSGNKPPSVDTWQQIWDGSCDDSSKHCCQFNNPPWFYQLLASPTTEDIQMRLCQDQVLDDEEVQIEQIEIYVQ